MHLVYFYFIYVQFHLYIYKYVFNPLFIYWIVARMYPHTLH